MDRLEALSDGRLRYWFKTAWRDGTTHAIFEPLEFMEKLAALVPTPRAHLVRFHGLLGPAAKWRPSIIPNNATTEAPPDSPDICRTTAASSGANPADCCEKQTPADPPERHGRNYTWSELMKRVFAAVMRESRAVRGQALGSVSSHREHGTTRVGRVDFLYLEGTSGSVQLESVGNNKETASCWISLARRSRTLLK